MCSPVPINPKRREKNKQTEITNPRITKYRKRDSTRRKTTLTQVTFITTTATRNNWRFCDLIRREIRNYQQINKKKLKKKHFLRTKKKSFVFWQVRKEGKFQRSPEKKRSWHTKLSTTLDEHHIIHQKLHEKLVYVYTTTKYFLFVLSKAAQTALFWPFEYGL